MKMNPYEIAEHVLKCEYRPTSIDDGQGSLSPPCPFESCGCTYKMSNRDQLDAHLKNDMVMHLNVSRICNK